MSVYRVMLVGKSKLVLLVLMAVFTAVSAKGDELTVRWQRTVAELERWADSTDIEVARRHFLDAIRQHLEDQEPGELSQAQLTELQGWLEDARGIAVEPQDVALANGYWALLQIEAAGEKEWGSNELDELESALTVATDNLEVSPLSIGFYRALGDFTEKYGYRRINPDGQLVYYPDYQKALKIYEQLLDTEVAGAEVYEEISHLRKAILSPELKLECSYQFLPDSVINFYAHWRNLEEVEVVIERALPAAAEGGGSGESEPVWREVLNAAPDVLPHHRHERRLQVDAGLAAGDYRVRAISGEVMEVAGFRVTDLTMRLWQHGNRWIAWLVRADTGAPVADFPLQLSTSPASDWIPEVRTDTRGFAEWFLDTEPDSLEVVGLDGSRPVSVEWVCEEKKAFRGGIEALVWMPAGLYRPGEKVTGSLALKRGQQGVSSVRVEDPEGGIFAEYTVNATNGAWWHFEKELAVDAAEGVYTVYLLGGDKTVLLEEFLFEVAAEVTEPDLVMYPQNRLLHPGETLSLHFEVLSEETEGVLIVTRERWRTVYQHRRKGNEISGDEYGTLPERALLGAAQSDFVLKEEGFITEEIDRRQLNLKKGYHTEEWILDTPGYYQLNWIADRQGISRQVIESVVWVGDDAHKPLGYRPSGLAWIPDRVSVEGRRRLLLVSPDVQENVAIISGNTEFITGALIDMSDRVAWIEAEDAGNAFEASYFSSWQWHQANYIPDQVNTADSFALQVDWKTGDIASGKRLPVTVSLSNGRNSVELPVCFWIRLVRMPETGSLPVADISQSLRLIKNSAEMPWNHVTGLGEKPFYQLWGSPLGSDVGGREGDSVVPMKKAEQPSVLSSRIIYRSGPKLLTEGEALRVELLLPDTEGKYRVDVAGVDASWRAGTVSREIEIRSPELLRWEIPGLLRVGEQTEIIVTEGEDWVRPHAGLRNYVLEAEEGINILGKIENENTWRIEAEAEGVSEIRLRDEKGQLLLAGQVKIEKSLDEVFGLHFERWKGRAISVPADANWGTAPGLLRLSLEWMREQVNVPVETLSSEDLASRLICGGALWNTLNVLGYSQDEIAVFLSGVAEYLEKCVDELTTRQNEDGGWSWSGIAVSDWLTSSWVTRGLLSFQSASGNRMEAPLENALSWNWQYLLRSDITAEMRLILLDTLAQRWSVGSAARPNRLEARVFLDVWQDRSVWRAQDWAKVAFFANRLDYVDELNETGLALAAAVQSGIGPSVRGDIGWYGASHFQVAEVVKGYLETDMPVELAEPYIEGMLTMLWNPEVGLESRAMAFLALVAYSGRIREGESYGETELILNGESYEQWSLSPGLLLDVPDHWLRSAEGDVLELDYDCEGICPDIYVYHEVKPGGEVSAEFPGEIESGLVLVRRVPTLLKGDVWSRVESSWSDVFEPEDHLVLLVQLEAEQDFHYNHFEWLLPSALLPEGVDGIPVLQLMHDGEVIENPVYSLQPDGRVIIRLTTMEAGSYSLSLCVRVLRSGEFSTPVLNWDAASRGVLRFGAEERFQVKQR